MYKRQVLELFKLAKKEGINTCIDTSGGCFTREEPFFSKFNELMEYTDLLLVDIKEINNERHQLLTGRSNENILDMARYLSEIDKPIWIRHVLVPERSDYDEDLIELDHFISTLSNVYRVEILPYHTLGVFKWEELNIPYQLEGIKPPVKELSLIHISIEQASPGDVVLLLGKGHEKFIALEVGQREYEGDKAIALKAIKRVYEGEGENELQQND